MSVHESMINQYTKELDNEAKEMNDVADYVEAELKNYGVKVYRNNPNGNINLWNSEAKYYNCDFKIAIHSNASGSHNTYGIETWIDEEGSASYSIANIIQEAINETAQVEKLEELENDLNGVKNIINKVAGLSAEQMNLSEKEKQEILDKMKK